MKTYREMLALLPQEVHELLVGAPAPLGRMIVNHLRVVVEHWESRGVTLDPVQFDAVVSAIAFMTFAQGNVITGLAAAVDRQESPRCI